MADKVVSLEFNVKTAGAVTEINKVTKATEGATAATNEYEKQLADIKKATEGAGFKDLNKALKQYQDLALQAGSNTPIGKQALAEAGELKDRLMDLKTAIRTTGQDGRALQASLQLGGGIVAGFGAVQGVMALVGSESEDLQKTLVKLQAVQATLASVEEIRSVLEKESALRITAVTIAEKGRAAATAIATWATTASSAALKVFKIALIGTGIGAFIVLLGFVAEKMGLFGNATDEANEKLERQKKIREDLDAQIENDLKRDLDVRKSRQGGLNDIKAEIEILKAKGATSTEIYLTEKKLIQEQLNNLAYAKGTRGKLNADELEEQRKLQLDKYLLNLKYIKDSADALDIAQKEKYKKWREERQVLNQQRADNIAAVDKEIEDEKSAEAERMKVMQANMIARTELFAADLQAQKDSHDTQIALEKELQATKVNLAMQGFELINDLMQLNGNNSKAAAKRAFEINKAFQIAQATMEGYRAVLSTYAETPGGPVIKGIAAGLAGAFAAVQIAKISQSKFDSSRFDNQSPNLNNNISNVRQPNINTTAPNIPGSQSTILRPQQPTMVKAIVVESDITSTQRRVNSIKETANI